MDLEHLTKGGISMARFVQGVAEVLGDGVSLKPKQVSVAPQGGRKSLETVGPTAVPAHQSSKKCPHCVCRKNRVRKSHVYGPFHVSKLTQGVQLVVPRVKWSWGTGFLGWCFGTPPVTDKNGWYEVHVYAYCSNPECPVPRERVKHIARKFSRFRLLVLGIKARLVSGIELIAPSD